MHEGDLAQTDSCDSACKSTSCLAPSWTVRAMFVTGVLPVSEFFERNIILHEMPFNDQMTLDGHFGPYTILKHHSE